MKTTIINANIFTSNKDMPYAKSMSFEHGKITEVSCNNLSGNNIIDAKGKFITPAFLDIHMHPLWIALNYDKFACLPPHIYSIHEIQNEIITRRKNNPTKWILGWGYDEGKMKEKRICTKYDLDSACNDFPVIIERTCSHICICNTAALLALNINPTNHDGVLRESEKFEAFLKIPKCTNDEIIHNLKLFSNDCFSKGITTVSEMLGNQNDLDIYLEAEIPQRILFTYDYNAIKDMDNLPPITNPKIKIQGIKLLADGSVSGQTAWCSKPYLNTENNGLSTVSDTEIIDAMNIAKKYQLQLIVHAMGDNAINHILSLKTDDWLSKIPSLRIEHYAILYNDLLKSTKNKHVAIVSQPIFMYAEIESYLKNLGNEFKSFCYPYKSILDQNIPLAFSSDAPATSWADPFNPFIAINSACKRQSYNGIDSGINQSISIEDAIHCYTSNAAKIVGLDNVGMIKEGMSADFIILNQNLFDKDIPIEDTLVLQTYMDGELKFTRNIQ